jgi:aryl-alcohol dehydrogenase-like predicted oxidoreductase
MKTRTIGSHSVSSIGLGAMPMSIEGRPDRERSIATIHAAIDAGVTFIDTADAYHRDAGEVGHNEELIAEALASYGRDTSHILVATKGGSLRPGDGSWTQDGRPEHLIEAAKASLARLGGETIGLYQFHRPDSIGALLELLEEGIIEQAGISNASVDQIDEAHSILGGKLVSVQNQFSPRFLSSRTELEHSAALGLAFLPWSPLGGISNAAELAQNHAAFAEVAERHDASPQQVTLAWELSIAPTVVPIPGSSRPASITDSAEASELDLTPDDIATIETSLLS